LTSRRCASCALSQEKQQAPSRRHAAAATRQDQRRRHHAAQRNDAARAHVQDPPAAHRSYIIDGERVPLSAALQVRIVVMLCTAAQSIAIDVSVDDESVGELAPIRVESELSTALDF